MKTWNLRKIRQGRVKIGGKWFRPDETHMKYDGRLDGMVYLFGLYKSNPDLAALWGTERAYRAKTDEEYKHEWETRPDCINGAFVWYSWRTDGYDAQ